ncbi:hypothetical protein [Nocardioides terrisoli]|uniref:hypothetical protein n=1 Tax=Nocardioides terrisoli TaxID=3388267 RepID=UPI00287BA48B|nr:hypothetical protein [Nocardioides marmorisolisilvae]
MGRLTATIVVLGVLVAGCGSGEHPSTHATQDPAGVRTSAQSSPSPPESDAPTPTPAPAGRVRIPASFPLAAGWGRGGGDGRPRVLRHPLGLDVHGVDVYVPTGALGRRTMLFELPEWVRGREVAVYGSPAAARHVIATVVRDARQSRRSRSEDGSRLLRRVHRLPDGTVEVLSWRRLEGHPAVGTQTVLLHRSGRALLTSTGSAEGQGAAGAAHLAREDLGMLRPALAALPGLG